jgi:hypothetical protein
MLRTLIRRLMRLALVFGLGAVVAAWFRGRGREALDPGTPREAQWPPLDIPPPPATAPTPDAASETPPIEEPSDGSAAPPPPGRWVEPTETGGCPVSHPIKVKLRSGIYHVPNGAPYDRTNADRCYADAAAAEADGYRASKT